MRTLVSSCLILCALTILACGDPKENDGQTPADAAVQSRADATPVQACTTHALPPGLEFEFAGTTRSTLLAGPTDLPTKPLPLVLNFHGYSDSAELQAGFSLMSAHAQQEGYIVAYPQGTGALKAWNAGSCCGTAASSAVDDVGFTEALIDEIAATSCIDRSRVYAVGYSNGGFLAHRLACELSDKIAGIASVAGVMGVADCNPARAIPIMQIHGTGDTIVPYLGNLLLGSPSVDSTMQGWLERSGCSQESADTYLQGDASCVAWQGCDAPVTLCTIDGGGHTWPGGTAPAIRGKLSTDLDATAAMWAFFQSATL